MKTIIIIILLLLSGCNQKSNPNSNRLTFYTKDYDYFVINDVNYCSAQLEEILIPGTWVFDANDKRWVFEEYEIGSVTDE